jgi:hypothetical protein
LPIAPFGRKTMKRWLKNAKAAELLGVSARTIKNWMNCPPLREALLAVRHGKQWKIPRPEYEMGWEWQTRRRLEEAGIHLKPSWEQELETVSKECDRYLPESYLLWLAAHLQLLKREIITDEDIGGVLSLWQSACEILKSLPEGTEVDKLKSQFSESLRARNFSNKNIRSIMSYWPDEFCFKKVRAARTWKELEKIRRGMDVAQAVKVCKQQGKKPTAENLRPLLHPDIMTHINDTREKLPGLVVQNPTPEQLQGIFLADLERQILRTSTGRSSSAAPGAPSPGPRAWSSVGADTSRRPKGPLICIDYREPQEGLALRTFRNRHPLRQSPQREIVATVYGARDNIPGADDRPCGRKTPVHDSALSDERAQRVRIKRRCL